MRCSLESRAYRIWLTGEKKVVKFSDAKQKIYRTKRSSGPRTDSDQGSTMCNVIPFTEKLRQGKARHTFSPRLKVNLCIDLNFIRIAK